MTINIPIEKLRPHPKNPRMDEGDVTELAASIKSLGVLQNLVVVETEPGEAYTVVAGHRRLKASKQLSLAHLPCLVVDMSEKEQVATMLSENVHRSALSPYEEARGFQLMMDLGETQKGVSELTGLSASTVRSRVKLLELDADKFKASSERGATLMDYAALNDIEDIAKRNELLDHIGTRNFDYKFKEALTAQKNEKKFAEIIAALDTFAEKCDAMPEGTAYMTRYSVWGKETPKAPEDAATRKYYYRPTGMEANLYAEKTEADKLQDAENRARRDENRAKEEELSAALETADALRTAFIRDISDAQCRKLAPQIAAFAVRAMTGAITGQNQTQVYWDAWQSALDGEGYDNWDEQTAADLSAAEPLKVLLVAAWAAVDHTRWGNAVMLRLYAELETLGYAMSDNERALFGEENNV
jgi:ParB family chromosome partitioning protein